MSRAHGTRNRAWVCAALLSSAMFGLSQSAAADDATTPVDADGADVLDDAGATDDASAPATVPLACDGALCDTTNLSMCALHHGVVGGDADLETTLTIYACAMATVSTARLRRRGGS